MDTSDLFASCRKGDVGRVRYLLELVLYLLANGARCEANTFDGERCLYGALSDPIRRALRLCGHEELWDLLSDLEAKCEKVSEFVASKPGTCVKVLTIEPPPADPRLREDMALLADCALPPELRAFFCGRSDYFRALLDDHFRESEEPATSGGPPAVTLHGISPDVFTHVLYYMYSDHTELSPEAAYDVLSVADMYLLPGLKRLCGRSLAQMLDEDTVVGVWRVAKLFRLARLEDQCTEYMAKVIEKLVEREDFVEAVKEEAAAVAARQETDSIPLVDDIRFHVASTVQTYSAIEEAQQRLRALLETSMCMRLCAALLPAPCTLRASWGVRGAQWGFSSLHEPGDPRGGSIWDEPPPPNAQASPQDPGGGHHSGKPGVGVGFGLSTFLLQIPPTHPSPKSSPLALA
uniref:Isoform 4 of Ankyrin repeat and BTB/POZ domain-containing protein 1 n=1 Tax=Homo sapiens TaxID=9606 RepID=Q969K4-4|nr:unnamed protein product [Homo sapiens]